MYMYITLKLILESSRLLKYVQQLDQELASICYSIMYVSSYCTCLCGLFDMCSYTIFLDCRVHLHCVISVVYTREKSIRSEVYM